jgi:hypothetical protein
LQLQDLRWIVRDGPSLVTRRRIILLENLLDDQIDIQRAASVTQEKSLLTVADENETVMGNDVGARSMEFSFHNHLPMLQIRMVRCAIRRRSPETITTPGVSMTARM